MQKIPPVATVPLSIFRTLIRTVRSQLPQRSLHGLHAAISKGKIYQGVFYSKIETVKCYTVCSDLSWRTIVHLNYTNTERDDRTEGAAMTGRS